MSRILVVDDDDSFSLAFCKIIQSLGHTVERAVDGEDGLAKFRQGVFDVIITDLKMPKMDGIEFLKQVKKQKKEAIVLVITAYADMETAIEALKAGAYDYISKPIELDQFKIVLDRGLEKQRLLEQLNFSKGWLWTIIISIPLWLILGIILALVWK